MQDPNQPPKWKSCISSLYLQYISVAARISFSFPVATLLSHHHHFQVSRADGLAGKKNRRAEQNEWHSSTSTSPKWQQQKKLLWNRRYYLSTKWIHFLTLDEVVLPSLRSSLLLWGPRWKLNKTKKWNYVTKCYWLKVAKLQWCSLWSWITSGLG